MLVILCEVCGTITRPDCNEKLKMRLKKKWKPFKKKKKKKKTETTETKFVSFLWLGATHAILISISFCSLRCLPGWKEFLRCCFVCYSLMLFFFLRVFHFSIQHFLRPCLTHTVYVCFIWIFVPNIRVLFFYPYPLVTCLPVHRGGKPSKVSDKLGHLGTAPPR